MDLHAEKIRRRVVEDARHHRRHRSPRIGRWHWVRVGVYGREDRVPEWARSLWDAADTADGTRPRYHPAKALEADERGVVVGYAELGTTERIQPDRLSRPLSPEEMSDHLRREPVGRIWPEPA